MYEPKKIAPLTQPTPYTCVHTCLALVAGQFIPELIERFGDKPLGRREETMVLVENHIFPVDTTGDRHQFAFSGIYLVSTPSLNMPGKLHMVVVEADQNGYTVIDPNNGRADVKVYDSDAVMAGDLARCEVTYLDYDLLREARYSIQEKEEA